MVNNNNTSNTTGTGSPRNTNNNGGRGKKSNKNKNSTQRGYNKPVVNDTKFTGRVSELEGNVFDSSTRKSIERYNEVIENIKIYIGSKYKCPDMMIHILDHMESPKIEEPEDIAKNAPAIKKKIWEERVKRYIEKEETLEEGKKKLFLLLWGQCTDIMQTEIRSLQDYEKMSKAYDPIELLKAIKSITFSF